MCGDEWAKKNFAICVLFVNTLPKKPAINIFVIYNTP